MSTTVDSINNAQARRMRLVALRRDLRAGEVALADLMANPPPELANVSLGDVLRWLGSSAYRRSARITTLGRWAVRDGVNLMQSVDEASVFSRAWVAENGLHGLQKDRWAA